MARPLFEESSTAYAFFEHSSELSYFRAGYRSFGRQRQKGRFTRVRAFSPSLRARGTKTRETPSQQPRSRDSRGLTMAAVWLLFGDQGRRYLRVLWRAGFEVRPVRGDQLQQAKEEGGGRSQVHLQREFVQCADSQPICRYLA